MDIRMLVQQMQTDSSPWNLTDSSAPEAVQLAKECRTRRTRRRRRSGRAYTVFFNALPTYTVNVAFDDVALSLAAPRGSPARARCGVALAVRCLCRVGASCSNDSASSTAPCWAISTRGPRGRRVAVRAVERALPPHPRWDPTSRLADLAAAVDHGPIDSLGVVEAFRVPDTVASRPSSMKEGDEPAAAARSPRTAVGRRAAPASFLEERRQVAGQREAERGLRRSAPYGIARGAARRPPPSARRREAPTPRPAARRRQSCASSPAVAAAPPPPRARRGSSVPSLLRDAARDEAGGELAERRDHPAEERAVRLRVGRVVGGGLRRARPAVRCGAGERSKADSDAVSAARARRRRYLRRCPGRAPWCA